MKLRGHTLGVLIQKDFKLMFSNKNVIIMILMPILFALFYQMMFGEEHLMDEGGTNFVLSLCALLNLSAVPLSALAMMVAEEKEKNTMRVLMLSDVSGSEYVLSKILTTLCVMIAIMICIFFITENDVQYLPLFMLVNVITSISALMFGAVVGMLSKDQMSTGTLSTPFMVLFLMPPMFRGANEVVAMISKIVPTTSMMNLSDAIFMNQSIFTADFLLDFGIIAIWIVLGIAVFLMMYRKKGFDN